MKIDNIKDAKPGDWIKAGYHGHLFEGETWADASYLSVGATRVRCNGEPGWGITILSIERPEPKLPTEGGSVIMDVRWDTVWQGGNEPVMFLVDDGGSTDWESPTGLRIPPDKIVSFTPAKVVPE